VKICNQLVKKGKNYGFQTGPSVVRSNFCKGPNLSWKRAKGQTKILGPASVIWDHISEIWPQKGQPDIPDSDVQHCELYISNIVWLWCNNNVLGSCTTMNNWRTNCRYFLFRHLHSTSCTTNWPTWSLNGARWCKKFHNDASTCWIKK